MEWKTRLYIPLYYQWAASGKLQYHVTGVYIVLVTPVDKNILIASGFVVKCCSERATSA